MPRIAVIGLGRFGITLARALATTGAEVIAIDRNGDLVQEISEEVDLAVRLDSTNREALEAQAVGRVDQAIVSIGEGFEAALLTTLHLKSMGVPTVIARAQSRVRAQILKLVGADEVLSPERESALRLARQLTHPHLEDYVELAEGHSIISLRAPSAFHNKTLHELNLRRQYRVNLIAIKRRVPIETPDGAAETSEQIISVPEAETVIQPNDVLVLIGTTDSLGRLPQR